MNNDLARLHAELQGARDALAHAAAEMQRLDTDLDMVQAALKQSRQVVAAYQRAKQLADAELDAARTYILYTEAKYPGDEHQIEMLTRWLAAHNARGG